MYLVVGSMGLITYILSSVFVYVSEKDLERSAKHPFANLAGAESGVRPAATTPAESMRQRHGSSGAIAGNYPVQTVRAKTLIDGEETSMPRLESRRETGGGKRQLLI